MSHQRLRQRKIEWILNVLKEEGEVDEMILGSRLSLEFGSGKRYVRELLEDLCNVGKIIRIDGKVKLT